jgi:NAD(P)-dependent dehydrogenase (short-subunit alcohol dehydrogenase family)
MRQFDLRGKTAVITGAGGALCGAMAEALARAGVRVAILDVNLDKAREREGDPRGSTTQEFLEIDEIARHDLTSFLDLELEGFQSVFNLNFLGTFLPTKVFARGMVAKRCGSIINVSSMSALTPLTKVSAYSAAKAAVANFTRWLAVHLSHAGIRVNALAPGFFMTEQLRFLHVDQKTGEYTPRARKVVAHTPMGRYGEPDDLIGTVIYLLSDASRFVTGVVIPIDGGFSSYTI